MSSSVDLSNLGKIIDENLRIQGNSKTSIEYISVSDEQTRVTGRLNHVIFGRRGCGKTLLLRKGFAILPKNQIAIYFDCEKYKQHSYPNVLIEFLINVLKEIKRKCKPSYKIVSWIKTEKHISRLIGVLKIMKANSDTQQTIITEKDDKSRNIAISSSECVGTNLSEGRSIKKEYEIETSKDQQLNNLLPEITLAIESFMRFTKLETIFLLVDDFYHFKRTDQPQIADYINRLCKGTGIQFKIATLRHSSVLYRQTDQPIGIQEGHEYQPIDIEFSFLHFNRTLEQNKKIIQAYLLKSNYKESDFNRLFKGQGFERIVMAGGGVPRDVLSLFSQISRERNEPIGKDDVRLTSSDRWIQKLEELKQDTEIKEQEHFVNAAKNIVRFCRDEKQVNCFMVSDSSLRTYEHVRELLYRLMDYRVIHLIAKGITHKSQPRENFQTFMVDIGAYGDMRVLKNKLREFDLSDKDDVRSAPIITNIGDLVGSDSRHLY